MATQETLNQVQQLYVAYYGRPADAEGLAFWADALEANNGDTSVIINDFGNSAEFDARFGEMSNEERVNNLYQQLFGRDADAEGLAFYTNDLDSGNVTLAQIAATIAGGAQDNEDGYSDLTTLNNKVAAANLYTDAAGDKHSGTQADNYAAEWLATIDASTDVDAYDIEAVIADLPESTDTSDLTEGLTFAEARALKDAGELPDEYTIKDNVANTETAARDLYDNAEAIIVVDTVANLTDDNDALVDIAGEANTTYQIEDTLANIVAADDSLVENADKYSLTDATDGLLLDGVAVNSEELAVLVGAQNADDYSYTLEDTAANLQAADDALVAGAESVNITDADESDLGGDDISVADAILIQKAGLDVDYTVKDTAENILAAEDALADVEFTVAPVNVAETLSVDEATFLQNAKNGINLKYNVEGSFDELTDGGNLRSVVSGAERAVLVDTLANVAGASNGVINGLDSYTIEDTLANLAADDSGLVQGIVEAGESGVNSLKLTDGDFVAGGDPVALGALSKAEAAIVRAAANKDNYDFSADFTLTGDTDTDTDPATGEDLAGTDNDDTFRAEKLADDADGNPVYSLTGNTQIEGGEGNDTLYIADGAIEHDTILDNVTGIETIVKEGNEGSPFNALDVTNVTGLETIETDFSNMTVGGDFNATYRNVEANTTIRVSNVANQDANGQGKATIGVGLRDAGTEALNVSLADNGADSYYAVNALPDTTFTTANINAEEGNGGTLLLGTNTELTTINVKGAGDLSFQDYAYTALTELNASKSTGDISFGNINKANPSDPQLEVAADFTATTGAGNDTIDLTSISELTGDVEVSTGAGNDTIKVDLDKLASTGTLSLAGGAGNDSFVLSGSNAADVTVTITDFDFGNNTLTIEGVEGALKLGEELSADSGVNVAFDGEGKLTVDTNGDDVADMTVMLTDVTGVAINDDGGIVIA